MQGYNRNKSNFKPRQFSNSYNKKPNQGFKQPEGLAVALRDGEDINKALRRLKKKLERANLMKELRDRQYYVKPSEKKRKAKQAGKMRWKKRQRELERNL